MDYSKLELASTTFLNGKYNFQRWDLMSSPVVIKMRSLVSCLAIFNTSQSIPSPEIIFPIQKCDSLELCIKAEFVHLDISCSFISYMKPKYNIVFIL